MMKHTLLASILLAAISLTSGPASAASDTEAIYGSQMMTEQERNEHRNRLREATSAEEKEQIRNEHHEQMKQRATERGVSLPDEPPARGSGMGRNGSGTPKGGGMGPGGGKQRGR